MRYLMTKTLNFLIKVNSIRIFGSTRHHVHPLARVYFAKNISGPGKLTIARGCIVNAFGGIQVNGDVHLSERSCIYSVGYDRSLYPNERRHVGVPVIFEGDAWLAASSIVWPGAIIPAGKIIIPPISRPI